MSSEIVKEYNPLVAKIDSTKNATVFVIAVGNKSENGITQKVVPSHLRAAQEAAKSVLESEGLEPRVSSTSYEIPEITLNDNETLRLDVSCEITVDAEA